MAIGNKFKLLKRLFSTDESLGVTYFLKPAIVWATLKGGDHEQLIQITEVYYGTGGFKKEHIYTTSSGGKELAADLELKEVEFIPADKSFLKHLAKGEGVWKGVNTTFTDGWLIFEFYIWKDGDGNGTPTAGKVTGTYKLERKPDGGLRISMDIFKREAIKDSDR